MSTSPSQRPKSDLQIERSLACVADVLSSRARSIERRFRARLSAMRFKPQHVDALCAITPGAAVQAFGLGMAACEFFDRVKDHTRRLALMNVSRIRVAGALAAYNNLAAAAFNSRRRPCTAEELAARSHLNCALLIFVNEAFNDLRGEELALLNGLIDIDADISGVPGLLHDCTERLRSYFAADCARAYTLSGQDGATVRPIGDGQDTDQLTVSKAVRTRLARIRHIGMGVDGLVLDPDWQSRCGSVWSVPVAGTDPARVLQLGFPGDRPMLERETALLAAVAARVRSALDRLEREQEVQGLSVRMLEVEENERRRMGRQLHDTAAQSLVVVRLHLELIENALPEGASSIREQLGEARVLLEQTILDVRALIASLSPAVLQQLGLETALRQLVKRFRESYGGRLRFRIGKLPPVNHHIQLVVYRVLQECFTNISRHSSARNINVSVTAADRVLRLHVEDDGVGFHVEEGLNRRNCFGLVGIRERVALLGGCFAVKSTPRGGETVSRRSSSGTKIDVELPLPEKYPS